MSEPKKSNAPAPVPHGHRDRGGPSEPLKKGEKDRPAGAHDAEIAGIEADERLEPDRDGSRS